MRLNNIHVSSKEPVNPSLWVDTSGKKPILKGYVNGQYVILSEDVPDNVITKDMIVNSLDSEAIDLPLSAAQGKVLSEEVKVTYQKITDNTLATTAKTVVGAINEINEKVSEIPESETYEITLYSTIRTSGKRPEELTSEEIDTAVGGWDNFTAAVLEGKSIKEIVNYSPGDTTWQTYVSVSYEASITTVPSEDIEMIALSISRLENYIMSDYGAINIRIFNNNGILTLSFLVNGVLMKENEYWDLQTTDKTIIGGINENTGNITRIDRAVGNPVIEEVDLSSFDEVGYYWTAGGQKSANSEYSIKHIALKKGDMLLVQGGGTKNAQILTATDSTYSVILMDTGINGNGSENNYAYIAPTDCFIAFSTTTNGTVSNKANIIKSPFNTAISDNSYMQYLHKVYEEYGAVYNAETGYWEYGDLKDMTEEDCFLAAFYALEQIQGENQKSFILDRYKNPSAKTYFTKITPKGSYNTTKLVLDSCFAQSNKLEYLKLSDTPTSTFLFIEYIKDAFRGCPKLRKIEDILTIYTSNNNNITHAFTGCSALKDVKIRLVTGANVGISFEDSRLLSYESIKYLVDNAGNTAAITITVHPTTYSYLTGTAQPTEEVGGTTEEWQALVTTAQGKQISFAQPAETLEVEPLE